MEERLQRLMKRHHDEGEAGFTLIELLVVLGILGILVGIVLFATAGVDKGQANACKAERNTVLTAQEAYFNKNNAYAPSGAALVSANLLKDEPTWHNTSASGTTTLKAGVPADCTS